MNILFVFLFSLAANAQGQWTCRPAIPSQGNYEGRGKNLDFAQNATRQLCFKEQCASIGKQMAQIFEELKSLSDDEFDAFLESVGYSVGERSKLLELRSRNSSELKAVDCKTGGHEVIETAATICLTTPMNCEK